MLHDPYLMEYLDWLFFFFQAEDGIRDLTVTGVQTCALPIYDGRAAADADGADGHLHGRTAVDAHGTCGANSTVARLGRRSEEHTSELQSQSNIVCRLLLEKKKQPTLCTSAC